MTQNELREKILVYLQHHPASIPWIAKQIHINYQTLVRFLNGGRIYEPIWRKLENFLIDDNCQKSNELEKKGTKEK